MIDLAGIERILSCKMNYLSENTSHQIYLMTYEQQNKELSFQLNSNISYLPMNNPMPQRSDYSFINWIKAYLYARRLFMRQFQTTINDIHPDIVICTVYSYHVLDIIIKTANRMKAKTILESHIKGDTVSIAKYQTNRILLSLFSLWDKYILKSLKKCDCIVTLTKEDILYWKRYSSHIEVIPNMLTISPQKVNDYRTKRIIAAGRYTHQKGYDLLLEAWHHIDPKYYNWHLFVFGNGDKTTYQHIVDKYNMNKNVHLMSATKDIVKEFSNSSIYVMSSRFEGFPLVLGEAMSCGLPCISFDCPYGPRDIISDGEDGIIVENGNIRELSQKLEYLMSDVGIRQAMGEKASINISRYKPEFIMKQWIHLFNNL